MNIRAHIDIENASVEEVRALTGAYLELIGGVGRAIDGRPRPQDPGPGAGPDGAAPAQEACSGCALVFEPPIDDPERCTHCPRCGTVRARWRGTLPALIQVAPMRDASPPSAQAMIPPPLQNPMGATLPPQDDVLATAQAIVNGEIRDTRAPGGPGNPNQPPRRRPDPARVQAVAGLLLDAHLAGAVSLGKLEQVGAVETIAEQVLTYLDAGGRPPPAVVRQADAGVPAVIRELLDAELLAIAHEHVAQATADAPPVVAPNAIADPSTPPAATPAAPASGSSPPSPGSAPAESPAGGVAPAVETQRSPDGSVSVSVTPPPVAPPAAPTPAPMPPLALAKRPIADVERAMRLVLPHLASLLFPVGGLVNYAAGVIARAGLPSHIPGGLTSDGARPLVHLARATASTLVGLCATKHIGLQSYMERDHYAPGADQGALPAPGMLGVDDGARGNPFMHRNEGRR